MDVLIKSHKSMKLPGFTVLGALLLVWTLREQASAEQDFVCSPNNSTPPLTCMAGQWVNILAELYAPQLSGGGATCQLNMTGGCNSGVYGGGLQANCNGPVVDGAAPCQEEVNVAAAQGREQCLRGSSEVAALVRYSCINDAEIYDMCDSSIQLTSQFASFNQMIYLASPGFPSSPRDGTLCSCNIKGSRLRVKAVDVHVDARLPWSGDTNVNDDHQTVLAIRTNTSSIWRSDNCAACSSVSTLNTILVSTSLHATQELTITYSDFGLGGQGVWLQVTEIGPNLTITCTSQALPPNRVITTPAPPTSAPPVTAPQTTTVTTDSSDTEIGVGGGGQGSGVNPTPRSHQTTPSGGNGQGSGNRGGGGGGSKAKMDDGGDSDSGTMVAVLVVVLLLLVLAAVIIGIVLYRRRGKCQGDDGEHGLKPMIASWYRNVDCRNCIQNIRRGSSDDQSTSAVARDDGEFHGAATASGQDGGPSDHRGVDTHDHASAQTSNGSSLSSKPKHAPNARSSKSSSALKKSLMKSESSKKKLEPINERESPTTIIHNEVYQSHLELVGEEMVKQKQHKRQQKELSKTLDPDDTGTLQLGEPLKPSGDVPGDKTTTGLSLQNGADSCKRDTVVGPEISDHNQYESIDRFAFKPIVDEHISQTGNLQYEDVEPVYATPSKKKNKRTSSNEGIHSKSAHSVPDYETRHEVSFLNPAFNSDLGPEYEDVNTHKTVSEENGADILSAIPTSPSKKLFSTQERDMFAAIGLTEGKQNKGYSQEQPKQYAHRSIRNSGETNKTNSNIRDKNITTKDIVQSTSNTHAQGENSPKSKPIRDQEANMQEQDGLSKTSKHERVADILEQSLKDIQGKRKEAGSDKSSSAEDLSENIINNAEELALGVNGESVQASDC